MPADTPWSSVLALPELRIEVRPGSDLPVAQPWFEVRLHARSHPFAGTVESAWFAADLRALRAALTGLAGAGDDDVSFTVGGYRAAELVLTGGPTGDDRWLTARLTPNGDDPHPVLELLLWTAPSALVSGLDALDALVAGPR